MSAKCITGIKCCLISHQKRDKPEEFPSARMVIYMSDQSQSLSQKYLYSYRVAQFSIKLFSNGTLNLYTDHGIMNFMWQLLILRYFLS